jgi:ATP-dependent DNA helicase RecQ
MQCDGQDNAQWEVLMNSLSSQSNIRLLALKTLLVYLELEGVLKPAYSYYAEYKFKLLVSHETLLSRFKGERYHFVDAILQSAQKARTWSTMDFDKLNTFYPNASDRNRAITAIDYLDQQGFIELQTKQMTNVYRVFKSAISDNLRQILVNKFAEKEQSEVQRIHFLLAFFASDQCLSLQLAHYFSDQRLQQNCGHCSVCRGAVAMMPPLARLPPLTQYNALQLSQEAATRLGEASTSTLLARFFCGLTTPIFTRLKMRQITGFAQFEKYRFADVKAWIENK